MTLAALRLLAAAAARLPPSCLPRFGTVLGWAFGSMFRVRRALVEEGMRRASVANARATADAMYRDLGRGLVELLWLAGASPMRREAMIAGVAIDDDSVRALDAALLRGPVVLFASHTGNWELAAAAAAQLLAVRGRSLVVVAKAIRARGVDAFTSDLREALGVRVVPPEGALGAVRRSLESGDVVAMPIDQVPDRTRHGVAQSFLGASALVDRAPATIAWRTRATALVVASEREGAAHRVRILASFSATEGVSGRRWIDEVTAEATAKLDAFVRAAPSSWLWLHRRWRAPRLVANGQPG